jgi:hypothetical protein
MFVKLKSTPFVEESDEQSIASFPVTVNVTAVVEEVAVERAKVAVGGVASIVTVIDADVEEFPAESVSVTETTQSPSPRVAKVQVLEVTTQETLVEPDFVAVNTAVPAKLPATLNVGVLSLVLLSVAELPKSDAAARSGVAGVGKVVALITTPVRLDEVAEFTPLTLCCEVKLYVPFAKAGEKVHEPDVPEAVKVQVTGEPLAGVAARVTVAPFTSPVRLSVGVLSAVSLSVDERPVSDAVSRSAIDGALTLVLKSIVDTSEILPALSRTTIYAFKSLPWVRFAKEAEFAEAKAVPLSEVMELPCATIVAADGAESAAG